jgi:hypothetical protein
MVRSHYDFHSLWHSCIDLQAHKAELESNLKSYMAFRDSRKQSTLPLVPLLTYVADIASLTADKAWVTKWSTWGYRSLCVDCMRLCLVLLTDFFLLSVEEQALVNVQGTSGMQPGDPPLPETTCMSFHLMCSAASTPCSNAWQIFGWVTWDAFFRWSNGTVDFLILCRIHSFFRCVVFIHPASGSIKYAGLSPVYFKHVQYSSSTGWSSAHVYWCSPISCTTCQWCPCGTHEAARCVSESNIYIFACLYGHHIRAAIDSAN